MASDIPSTQLAGWVEASGPTAHVILRRDILVPQPGPGEVLVKLAYTGVWYTHD